ncbi:MAG: DUF4290 domain-containing protein [Bacteroidales bacterium]|nr:DUF4290 domain-containing protein [Candidatus Cacconaster merdequi]
MDYNTQRDKLILPEYGRHVQKMIEQVKAIPDREKRSEQAKAVVQVMATLNPGIRDLNDFKHKLWDHAYVIAGLDLDIDSPFPAPSASDINSRPEAIERPKTPIKAACYGRNIESMIALIADRPDDEVKKEMIKCLATYMRQQYLIWNKDNVAEETIFADIEKLSGGKLKVPEDVHLRALAQDAVFNRPGMGGSGGRGGANFKKGNRNGRKFKK